MLTKKNEAKYKPTMRIELMTFCLQNKCTTTVLCRPTILNLVEIRNIYLDIYVPKIGHIKCKKSMLYIHTIHVMSRTRFELARVSTLQSKCSTVTTWLSTLLEAKINYLIKNESDGI